MVELDNMKSELLTYETPLAEVRASLDVASKEKRIEELDMEMQSPGFWDNPEVSNKKVKEAKNLKERAERKVRRAEAIQNWISHELNGEPFETTRVLVKWRRTQSVDIVDEYQIPDEYLSVKTVSKPDKMRIKGDLKEGVRIPGAVLVEKNNMIVK